MSKNFTMFLAVNFFIGMEASYFTALKLLLNHHYCISQKELMSTPQLSTLERGIFFYNEMFNSTVLMQHKHEQSISSERYDVEFFTEEYQDTKYPRICSAINKLRGLFLIC